MRQVHFAVRLQLVSIYCWILASTRSTKQTKNVTLTHQFSRSPEMKFFSLGKGRQSAFACCWGAFLHQISEEPHHSNSWASALPLVLMRSHCSPSHCKVALVLHVSAIQLCSQSMNRKAAWLQFTAILVCHPTTHGHPQGVFEVFLMQVLGKCLTTRLWFSEGHNMNQEEMANATQPLLLGSYLSDLVLGWLWAWWFICLK